MTLKLNNDKVIIGAGGSIHMKETTTPAAISNYGAIYPKSDNSLYFQDGDGNEHVTSADLDWSHGSNITTVNDVELPASGNVFNVYGGVDIETITTPAHASQTIIILTFEHNAGNFDIKHLTAGDGDQIFLAGAVDFTIDAVLINLTLCYDSATSIWREISRAN